MKELLLHGFRKIISDYWYELRIDKANYGSHHICYKYDWMLFRVCHNNGHYVLDVCYNDMRNRHILYSIPQVLEWVRMYKNI